MSEHRRPLVSVIIPAYNHERFIEEAIASVWQQTCSSLELIVLDDGSRDATGEIAERLSRTSPVPMQVIRKQNEGLSRTLNRGVELAQGEFIAICASDDRCLPNRIETLLTVLRNEPADVALAFGDGYMIDEHGVRTGERFSDGRVMRSGPVFKDLLLGRCMIPAPNVLYRRSVFDVVGGFNEVRRAEDRDMFLRITRNFEVRYVPECVAEYRSHNEQTHKVAAAHLVRERLETFFENVPYCSESADPSWLRKVTAEQQLWAGGAYYELRQFNEARRCIWHSLVLDPSQMLGWRLMASTLLGAQIVDLISSYRRKAMI